MSRFLISPKLVPFRALFQIGWPDEPNDALTNVSPQSARFSLSDLDALVELACYDFHCGEGEEEPAVAFHAAVALLHLDLRANAKHHHAQAFVNRVARGILSENFRMRINSNRSYCH